MNYKDENDFPFGIPLADGTQILSPKVDFAFKQLFGSEQNKELLVSLLKSILNIPKEDYDEISFKDPSLLKDFAFSKYGVLDVLLSTKSGTRINIEIQVLPKPNYKNRIIYYLSHLIKSQIKMSENYITINKTISISILNFNLIHDSINYKHIFHLYDAKQGVEFSDVVEIITLELPKLPDFSANDEAIPWLHFIKSEGKEEAMRVVEKYPHLKEAYDQLQELSLNKDAIDEYNMRLKAFYDETTMLRAREIAEENLEITTIELENTKSLLKDAENELKNAENKLKATAKNLLAMGLSIEQVSNATNLSTEAIQKL